MSKKAARVRTLRDLDLLEGAPSVSSTPSGKVPDMKVAHIPSLPQADACLQLLRRIHQEFYPIIERRGYRVVSVSEMCCCGDGLDHGVIEPGFQRPKRPRKRRTIMAKNMLGYNQSRGGSSSSHTIHLRMREAQNHASLLSYEQVAGTMAHELAHCVYGPHNASFYKLMDEILEQHAVLTARGVVVDAGGFPMHSEQAYVLGGGSTASCGKTGAAMAAEARRQKSRWMPQGPQKLGGDAAITKWLTPGEAAGAAAVARRLEDEKWCLPCNDDIVELLSSDDEQLDDSDGQVHTTVAEAEYTPGRENDDSVIGDFVPSNDSTPPLAVLESSTSKDGDKKVSQQITPTGNGSFLAIDLTEDSDDDNAARTMPLSPSFGWPCQRCTYRNEPQRLVCGACLTEKDNSAQIISKIVRDDAIERIKQLEVDRSRQDFGFNIYGNEKVITSKMNHLT